MIINWCKCTTIYQMLSNGVEQLIEFSYFIQDTTILLNHITNAYSKQITFIS